MEISPGEKYILNIAGDLRMCLVTEVSSETVTVRECELGVFTGDPITMSIDDFHKQHRHN